MATSRHDDKRRFGPGSAYEEPSRGMSGLVKVLIGSASLFGITIFGWVVWISYDEGVRTSAVKTVPVIRADLGNIKRKPDDPGGLQVPDQDKLVFNRLAPGQADEPVERLLARPEVPLALPVRENTTPAEKTINPQVPSPGNEVLLDPPAKLVEPAPAPQSPPQVAAAPPPPPQPPAPPPEPAEVVASTPSPAKPAPPPAVIAPAPPPPAAAPAPQVAAKTPEPAPIPLPVLEKAPKVVPAKSWGIQLVSLSDRKEAEVVWTQLQKSNKDLLGGLQLRVQPVKLSKGTFYRVQAVPLANRAAAASLCGTLKSRKQDCLVVPPKP